MRGSSYFNSIVGIKFCTKGYWGMTFGVLSSMVIVTVILAIYLRYRIQKKINVGYNFDDFDTIWKYKPCALCATSTLFAGICAGLLSIGSGIVISPILFRLGVRPEVVVSTTSVLYVLTSSIDVILYIISGKLLYDYALFLGIISLIGSLIGIIGIKLIVKHYQRSSIMIIAMISLLILCTIIVPIYGIIYYSDTNITEKILGYCPHI